MSRLFRTTLTIWSDVDPRVMELDDLAREAMSGDAIAINQETEVFSVQEARAHEEAGDIEHFFPELQEDGDED